MGTKRILCLLPLAIAAALLPNGGAAEAAEVTCTGHDRQVGRVIFGTPEDDTIVCRDTSLSLVILSLEGDDVIGAGNGNDVVFGGPGADIIFASLGRDHVEGGPGDDRLFGGDGDDMLVGGTGSDWIWGNAGKDFCDGQEGEEDWSSPSCIDDLAVPGLPHQTPPWEE